MQEKTIGTNTNCQIKFLSNFKFSKLVQIEKDDKTMLKFFYSYSKTHTNTTPNNTPSPINPKLPANIPIITSNIISIAIPEDSLFFGILLSALHLINSQASY
ncbi:hypothetical protein DNC80_14550 [Flavobacterium sp. SOK18b]|nr:hypothetical protein [Flavobacterium sp. SOK18b]